MQGLGVLAGLADVADDGVFLGVHQPGGLAHAASFLHVSENVDHLPPWQMGAVEDRPLAFAEAFPAEAAVEHADGFGRVGESADTEVTGPPRAVSNAAWVLTAVAREILHDGLLARALLRKPSP